MCKTTGDAMELHAEDLEHFIRRGYLIIPSRVPPEVHETIRSKAASIAELGPNATVMLGDDCLPAIPELFGVFDAPPVRRALKSVLGEEYLLHGHRHLHLSSKAEQMWHKDSYWGFRKVRHHRPRWCMMLYYPQETTIDMGPTHVLAGTQYWTVDSETLFQGEDILSDSSGSVSMFVEGSGAERQQKLKEAEQQLMGPSPARAAALAEDVSLTVPAGSCVLMHYDLFHRAGFRAKEDATTRFMFKFQFIRTREPTPLPPAGVEALPSPQSPGSAPSTPPSPCSSSPRTPTPPPLGLPKAESVEADSPGVVKGADMRRRRRQLRRRCPWGEQDLPEVGVAEEAAAAAHDAALAKELGPVLADVRAWLQGAPHPSEGTLLQSLASGSSSDSTAREVEEGLEFLSRVGGACLDDEVTGMQGERSHDTHDEVKLVAAAYSLARSPDRAWLALLCGLTQGSEAVARACCYGLAAAGPRAAAALMPLLKHAVLRVRILSAFALGECARPSVELLDAFQEALERIESWTFETAGLMQALSCLASRACSLGELLLCQRCVELALPYLQPSPSFNVICENACLVVLLAGDPTGDVGKKALEVLENIAACSGDPYAVGFAREILRRHMQVQTLPAAPAKLLRPMLRLQLVESAEGSLLSDVTP